MHHIFLVIFYIYLNIFLNHFIAPVIKNNRESERNIVSSRGFISMNYNTHICQLHNLKNFLIRFINNIFFISTIKIMFNIVLY